MNDITYADAYIAPESQNPFSLCSQPCSALHRHRIQLHNVLKIKINRNLDFNDLHQIVLFFSYKCISFSLIILVEIAKPIS